MGNQSLTTFINSELLLSPTKLLGKLIGNINNSRLSMNYVSLIYLFVAIVFEVIATTALKASESFSKLAPSVVVVLSYGIAFFFLSLTLRVIPVGVAYAIWAGVGVVLVSLVSHFLYQQKLDLPAIIGIFLIIVGVLTINILSKTSAH